MSVSLASTAPQLWEATLGQLLLRVTRQNYDTWLRSTVGLRFEGDATLVVAAANDLAADWLATRMHLVIAQAIGAVAGPAVSVRFEPSDAPRCGERPALQPSLLPHLSMSLNPRYTMGSFLESAFNRLALTAARDLSAGDGSYSPLFITGAPGSGKTHLLHAIAHEAAARSVRFMLAGAEKFLSEFTSAVRNRNNAAFRARYREVDLLLIDDVHLLLGKKATLNEFYLTIAGLQDEGQHVAVAGDPILMTSEVSRFRGPLRWGLVAPIEQPSTEERLRFVVERATQQGVQLPEEVHHYLALRVRSSIRDLEGAVNRVAALARISRDPIDIDFVAKALTPVSAAPAQQQRQPLPPGDLVETVCRHLNLEPEAIKSQKRNRELTYARHIAMYLLRNEADLTYSAIAQLLSRKDHSTVVHACSQLHKELPYSPTLRADIDAIRAALHTPAHNN